MCVYTSPRASWSPHPGPEEEDTCHVSTGPVGITAGNTDKLSEEDDTCDVSTGPVGITAGYTDKLL